MEIKKLQETAERLKDRKKRIEVSIQELRSNLTEGNIESTAEELRQLEIQLEITQVAMQSNQEKLQEHEKLLSSKEYKDKLKMQEKLSKQAQEQTRAIFEKLVLVQSEIKEVKKLLEKLNQLQKETSLENNAMKAYFRFEHKQPYSWLLKVAAQVDINLKEANLIKDKLEV